MNLPELQWLARARVQTAQSSPADLATLNEQLAAQRICFSTDASPRLVEQLRDCQKRRPDRLICSLLDGDPDLPLRAVLGLRQAKQIVDAIEWLRKITGIRRAWIVIDAALSAEWIGEIRKLAAVARMRIVTIRNDYPQSNPTLLLYTLLGKRLRPGQAPTEQGVLLLDGAAAWRLNASCSLTPIAVRDLVGNSCHYAVFPTGATISDLLTQLNIKFADRLIRMSDPLRDIQAKADRIVDGSQVTIHLMRAERTVNPDPCIRCGWCVEGCPVRIQPAGLLEASQRNDLRQAARFGLHACIECGICSYVCPSRLPLLGAIRSLRNANLVPSPDHQ